MHVHISYRERRLVVFTNPTEYSHEWITRNIGLATKRGIELHDGVIYNDDMPVCHTDSTAIYIETSN